MPTQKKVSQSKIPSRKHLPTPTPRAHTRGWRGTPESGKRGGGNPERNQQRDKGSGQILHISEVIQLAFLFLAYFT